MRKFLLLTFMMLMTSPAALAQNEELRIVVDQPNPDPVPIAIQPFAAQQQAQADLGRKMAEVITSDLRRSGLFKPVDQNAFIQDAASAAQQPRFGEWRAINAQALVTGTARAEGAKTRIEFRLWDVYAEKQLVGMAYTTDNSNWRRIAHIISDDIYSRLTGEDGYFDSRIVYIAESGEATDRTKQLAIMDYDGANHKYLTDGSYMVLTPRFSPNQQMITYLSYYNNQPRVYLYDLNTGRQEVLGNFPGMTFAPRFSPDGQKVAMSYARDGNTDIYVMDLNTRQPRRLTTTPGIDTAPSYSPNGDRIVFESDRSGSQQLYVMNANGSGATRITFGDGRYGNPVWSPRGDLIAFTKMQGGQFYIGVIRPDGSGERLITSAYHVEGPSWSPNGRVLTFFKKQRGGGSEIYTIDLTGHHEQEIPTPVGASDPAWGPLNSK